VFGYLGLLEDTPPSRRGWMARISRPEFAMSQRDRVFGTLIFGFIAVCGVSVLIQHRSWLWILCGVADLCLAVSMIVRCVLYIVQRRPLVSDRKVHRGITGRTALAGARP